MTPKEIIEIIKAKSNLSDLDIDEITRENGIADDLAGHIGDLKTTQLRRFFDSIKRIESTVRETGNWDEVRVPFAMLRPYLANARGRKLIPEEFFVFVSECLNKIHHPDECGADQTKKDFQCFVLIMESLVAYNRFHHPKGRD